MKFFIYWLAIAFLFVAIKAQANDQSLFPSSHYPKNPLSVESEPHPTHQLFPDEYYPRKAIPMEKHFHGGYFKKTECADCHVTKIPQPPVIERGIGLPRIIIQHEKSTKKRPRRPLKRKGR